MPTICFAQSIRSPVEVEPCKASGVTVSAVLEAVFANHARLCSYLLDDRGAVRKHVSVIVNGEAVKDREALSEAGAKDAEIFVMQALSGG
jgi:sulfur carrier protein ThiS